MGSILGLGIDLVEVPAFQRMLALTNQENIGRYFTPSELVDAGESETRIGKLAGRFALKEAVLKALGLGWGEGVSYADIEVVVGPLGQPGVSLHRAVGSAATQRGIKTWLVSTTHTSNCAMASVIALGD